MAQDVEFTLDFEDPPVSQGSKSSKAAQEHQDAKASAYLSSSNGSSSIAPRPPADVPLKQYVNRPGGRSRIVEQVVSQSSKPATVPLASVATNGSATQTTSQITSPRSEGASAVATTSLGTNRPARNEQQDGEQQPPQPAFEGEGLKEVGSAKRSTADDFDDEFDYAFSGGQREGQTHKQVYKAKPAPSHLITNVKAAELNTLAEDEEEEEEEEEEAVQVRPAASPAAAVHGPSHVSKAAAAAAASSFSSAVAGSSRPAGVAVAAPMGAVASNGGARSATATELLAAASRGSLAAPSSLGLLTSEETTCTHGSAEFPDADVDALSHQMVKMSESWTTLQATSELLFDKQAREEAADACMQEVVEAGILVIDSQVAPPSAPSQGTPSSPAIVTTAGVSSSGRVSVEALQHPGSQANTDLPSLRLLKALNSDDPKQLAATLAALQTGSGASGQQLLASPGTAGGAGVSSGSHRMEGGGIVDLNERGSGYLYDSGVSSGAVPRSPGSARWLVAGGRGQQPVPDSGAASSQGRPTAATANYQHSGSNCSGAGGLSAADSSSVAAVAATVGSRRRRSLLGQGSGQSPPLPNPDGSTDPSAFLMGAGVAVPGGAVAGADTASYSPANTTSGAPSGLRPGTGTATVTGSTAAVGAGLLGGCADEWEMANQLRAGEMMHSPHPATGSSLPPSPLVSYHEALLHFMAVDVERQRKEVLDLLPPEPGLFSRLMCLAPPPLAPVLKEQQLRLLCLARMGFDNGEDMHFRLLASLYVAFTGANPRGPVSRYGSHWAQLGFQGDDPATDLRGVGLLGLLHLCCLHQHDPANAGRIFRLSRDAEQEFPLAVVSLNISKWTLQVMREGGLSRDANSLGSLIEAQARFYVGTFYHFYDVWLKGRKTMRDSGFVLKDVEGAARKAPRTMVQRAGATLPEPGGRG